MACILFHPFVWTKNQKPRTIVLTSWQSGNEEYTCFLFIANTILRYFEVDKNFLLRIYLRELWECENLLYKWITSVLLLKMFREECCVRDMHLPWHYFLVKMQRKAYSSSPGFYSFLKFLKILFWRTILLHYYNWSAFRLIYFSY